MVYNQDDDDEFWEDSDHHQRQRTLAVWVLIGLGAGLTAFSATLIVQILWRWLH